jgi:proteasome lid subunit RPN8/RPN11
MILRLTTQQLNLLKEEVRKVHPIEACALIFGKITPKEIVVEKIVTVSNVLRSEVRFEIDPKTFYDTFLQSTRNGLEFIGFFHSHPAPANPSAIDLEFMRLWGEAVWLIFSSTEDRLAAFQIIGGKVTSLILKAE